MPHRFDHCNTEALAEAFGRSLTAEEMSTLSSAIQNTARLRLARGLDSNMDEALRNAVPDALITVQAELAGRQRAAAHNLAIVMNGVKNIKENWDGDLTAEGLKALVIGSPFRRKNAKRSVASEQQIAIDTNVGRFNSELSTIDPTGRLRGRYVRGELQEEIYRAGHAIDDVDGAGATLGDLDPDAVTLARLIMKHNEISRQSYNRAGGNIRHLPGRVVRRSHNTKKLTHSRKALAKAGEASTAESDKDAWVEYMLSELDFDRTFSQLADEPIDGDAIARTLGDSYESLSKGEHLQAEVSGSSGRVGSSLEQERIFFFKDGLDGEIKYHKIFGNDSLREDVMNELVLKGKKTGLMRALGPNAFQNLREITLSVQKMVRGNAAAEKRFKKIGADLFLNPESNVSTSMSRWWSELAGHNAHPIENMWTTIGASIRMGNNLAHLGRATLASVVDIAATASSFRFQGRGFLESYTEAFQGIFEAKRSEAYKREVWEALNIGTTVINNMGVSRGISDDTPIGVIGRMNNFYFKANLLSPWTDNMKRAAALSNARYLGIQSQKSWGALDEDLKGLLGTYGIEEADWQILSRVDYSNSPDGKAYLSIDAVDNIPDSAFPEGVDILATRDQLERKLRAYYADQADAAVPTPDAEVRALTTFGQPQGTFIGEMARFFFQFKAFPTTMYKRIVRREIYGRGTEQQNFFKAAWENGNGELQGMGELFTSATIMGYAALTLKDLSEGKTPRLPETASGRFQLLLDSMLQGGAAAIYGDILIGDLARENPARRGLLETFGGPTFSFIKDDVLGTSSAITYGMMRGDEGQKMAGRMWQSIENNMPYANTFWLKMSLDTVIMHEIGEDLSPGYSNRLKKAAENRGQEYFIPLP